MPDTPTLGQLAYNAWWTAFHGGGEPFPAWGFVDPHVQYAWDAAARAIQLDMLTTHPLLEGLTYPRKFTVEHYVEPQGNQELSPSPTAGT